METSVFNEIEWLRAENERLRAENSDMRRMLTNIVGDDEYLRIYAIEEAFGFLVVE